jgi:uncharacterized protein YprB with RNaseH-like and TPR domain
MTMDTTTLRERLRGIVRMPATSSATNRSAAIPNAHSTPIDSVASSPASRLANIPGVLGGEWRESDGARSFVVRRRFDSDSSYGRHRVCEFADAMRHAAVSAPLLGPAGAQAPFVFFDLETTGLSGGAGTHAFLVGCGWFDADGGFVTEQHLMLDHAGERSMLRVVAGELLRAGALVSFNGKSFDAPLLEMRYLFHRLDSPCAARPHVDLLHPARRFWGGASESGCSLVNLEAQVLGARRSGDVPGFEIPARYFHFLRTGEARPLRGVLEHNRLDLLSLAGLTARAFHLLQTGPGEAASAHEALALGRLYGRAGLEERADVALARAVVLCDEAPGGGLASRVRTKIDALRYRALGARRQGKYAEAAGFWRELLDVAGCPDHLACEALEALAVHHEHRARDLQAAKLFALRGLEKETETARGDATRHRLARIERKMTSERPSFPSSLPLPLVSGFPTSGRRTSS